MTTERDREDIQVLLRVSRMYYEHGRTQAQIAQEIGYSRPTVSRLLARAEERGVVTVVVAHPLERILSIEQQLTSRLGLVAARVAESGANGPIDVIGRMAAAYLVETLQDGQVLAIGNGRSVAATARHVPVASRPRSTVVQLLGSLPGGLPTWGRDSPTLVHRIASQFGATGARMPIPLFVDDPGLADALLREERVATALALASRADVALVGTAGVDALDEGNVLERFLTPQIEEAIAQGGAVGHILDHHFDASGRHVVTPLCSRTLSLSLESLAAIPMVIGVAAGEEKILALIAACRSGILNALVTDEETALGILRALERRAGGQDLRPGL